MIMHIINYAHPTVVLELDGMIFGALLSITQKMVKMQKFVLSADAEVLRSMLVMKLLEIAKLNTFIELKIWYKIIYFDYYIRLHMCYCD